MLKAVALFAGGYAAMIFYLIGRYALEEWQERRWIARFDRRARRAFDDAQGRDRVGL